MLIKKLLKMLGMTNHDNEMRVTSVDSLGIAPPVISNEDECQNVAGQAQVNDGVDKTQISIVKERYARLYEGSGTSFYSDLFPDHPMDWCYSSRRNKRVFLSINKNSEYYEFLEDKIKKLNVKDCLRVKQNGIFNNSNEMVFELAGNEGQVKYRDVLKVEEVYQASSTVTAYAKVEIIGHDAILMDFYDVQRKHISSYDGQNLLSVARNCKSTTEGYGYNLQLVEYGNTYYVILFYGSIHEMEPINIGLSGKGSDGCVVFGEISSNAISNELLSMMESLKNSYGAHTGLQYLPCSIRKMSLALAVVDGVIKLYVFRHDMELLIHGSTVAPNIAPHCNEGYVRLNNGKYRCASTGEIFVSTWYFEKTYNVKLNDVDVYRFAQADNVRHEKKCKIEIESARKIWGDYVYMYPESWLMQQGNRLW